MESSVQDLVRSLIETMGPEWWAAKVENTLIGSTIMFAATTIILVAALLLSLAGARHIWTHTKDEFDRAMSFLFGGFFVGFVVVLVLLGVTTAYTNMQQPEFAVWKELVNEFNLMLQ